MSYLGNQPNSAAFLTDQFSGNGSTTAWTLSTAPAGTTSILVSVSGILQDPSTYSVVGTTLTLGGAAPTGTGNISVRYLGIPASGVVTTAYRTVTEFTATAGQTTFTPPSYSVGFIAVYLNGARLGASDFTASNGTTIVLATGASVDDLVVTESFYISSVANAIPNIPNSVVESNIGSGAVNLTTKVTGVLPIANGGTGLSSSIYSASILIVAGGAGGGSAAGGGAGGYIATNFQVIQSTAYTVTVGAGGTGGSGTAVQGNNGANSVFGPFTSIGGGGGGSNNGNATTAAGKSGGSGGGAGYLAGNATGAIGTCVTSQGSNGGLMVSSSGFAGGGGGGAGGVGTLGSGAGSGGSGGNGLTWINGSTYAGGGGGGSETVAGTGGAGGGGAGGTGGSTTGVAGTTNTGSGGGGSSTGGAGGSGIVIVAYPGSTRGTGGTITSSGGYTYHTFTSSGTYTA
jgi:hypothetical protein